jgi:transposase
VLAVEQWAEIRRLWLVEKLSQREIRRRTGAARDTIRKAVNSPEPPSYGPRSKRPTKVAPFEGEIRARLADDPEISSQRLREICTELGYDGGKTIFDDRVRELRPLYRKPRTFQRTTYRPGELAQLDLTEPRSEIPVGWGQARKGYILTCELPHSRAFAGALIFAKKWPDIAWGMRYCLTRLGALPAKLVWDREGAIHAGGGRPTEEFAAFCGQLGVGWIILDAGDAQAKGALERTHRFVHGNFEAGRSFANHLDCQAQLDAWSDRINARVHRSTRARVDERLATERERMRPLPDPLPRTEHRFTLRVPPQPYFRFDRCDYSLDPRLVGRRVEIRAGQRAIVAVSLDSGEIIASHRRCFAAGLTFTDPAHQRALDQLRGERKRPRAKQPEVEIRPLARYDELIAA